MIHEIVVTGDWNRVRVGYFNDPPTDRKISLSLKERDEPRIGSHGGIGGDVNGPHTCDVRKPEDEIH